MSELDHWHPVLFSRELARTPRRVRLAGLDIVIFRATVARLGAFIDRCPHRGMRLSEGWMEGERLVCPYHGWCWSADGSGETPATPAARPRMRGEHLFEAVERHGAIWVKRAGPAQFPSLDAAENPPVTMLRHRAAAPIELVLDNMSEVEHSPYVHKFILDYGKRNRMAQVRPRLTISDDSVKIVNPGPAQTLPRPVSKVLGIPQRVKFIVEWTTRFSPVHSMYKHYFADPTTEEPLGYAIRSAVFFNPVGPESSEMMTFVLSTKLGITPMPQVISRPLLRAYMNRELSLDMKALTRLADKRTSLKGNLLGRFDKALAAVRKRVDTIYYGRVADTHSDTAVEHEPAASVETFA
jgi:phenylpropionate dioxygenase-like ring-hydroxylating dioxygenase large terminal subunit